MKRKAFEKNSFGKGVRMKRIITSVLLAAVMFGCMATVQAEEAPKTIIVDVGLNTYLGDSGVTSPAIISIEITNVLEAMDYTLDNDWSGNIFTRSEKIVAQSPCVITPKGIKYPEGYEYKPWMMWLLPLDVTAEQFKELTDNKVREPKIWQYAPASGRVDLDNMILQKGYYIMGCDSLGSSLFGYIEVKDGGSETTETTPPVKTLIANPTASTVLVNGKNVAFDAYNINDNNYFKLRDIAFILNGTEKQFEVGWDGANNAISLASGKPYTAAGGEMSGKAGGAKTPVPTDSKILLDGKDASFTAYNIDGNNYFKLRDIGEAFNFGVDWDGAKNTIVIDTKKGYGDESKTNNGVESGSSKYTYLKNFPTVPYFLPDSGLDPDKIKLVVDTKELVVYTIDFRGVTYDDEDEYSFSHEVFDWVFENEGFENISYYPSEDAIWYKYTEPGVGYNSFLGVNEKDGVLAVYVKNGGGAEGIDAFIVTNMK